jgi:hypothetical protein
MHAIETSISRVGFEPTIPVFERGKTVHALDSAATVIGLVLRYTRNFAIYGRIKLEICLT